MGGNPAKPWNWQSFFLEQSNVSWWQQPAHACALKVYKFLVHFAGESFSEFVQPKFHLQSGSSFNSRLLSLGIQLYGARGRSTWRHENPRKIPNCLPCPDLGRPNGCLEKKGKWRYHTNSLGDHAMRHVVFVWWSWWRPIMTLIVWDD